MVSGIRDSPPPSYPGRTNFSVISLQNSTNRLNEDREPVSGDETTRQLGWASCLALAGSVTLVGWTTFLLIPGTTLGVRVSRYA